LPTLSIEWQKWRELFWMILGSVDVLRAAVWKFLFVTTAKKKGSVDVLRAVEVVWKFLFVTMAKKKTSSSSSILCRSDLHQCKVCVKDRNKLQKIIAL
jgi:hypothetical protein